METSVTLAQASAACIAAHARTVDKNHFFPDDHITWYPGRGYFQNPNVSHPSKSPTAGPQLLISQHYILKSTVDADIGEQLKKCTFKQEQPPKLALKMGNCCAKNGELELFEKNLIYFKGQKYEEIKAR